ncbi:MAG TPA: DUF1641 domain-containing protein [Usitatibacter sp.]|nr:DUF1641 domain-containing protein [Usitatibacter sp.]
MNDTSVPSPSAQLEGLLHAMQDAATDDMVTRLAALASDVTLALDRLNASGTLRRVEELVACMAQAQKDVQGAPAPGGGLMALLAMLRDPENQRALQYFLALGRRMRSACAEPRR